MSFSYIARVVFESIGQATVCNRNASLERAILEQNRASIGIQM